MGFYAFENVVEYIAVGVDGHRGITQFPCKFHPVGQVFMHGGFTTKKDDIGVLCWLIKKFEPCFHGVTTHHLFAMLIRVNIAMFTGKIAAREHMKKDIAFLGLELEGGWFHGFWLSGLNGLIEGVFRQHGILQIGVGWICKKLLK